MRSITNPAFIVAITVVAIDGIVMIMLFRLHHQTFTKINLNIYISICFARRFINMNRVLQINVHRNVGSFDQSEMLYFDQEHQPL